MLELLAMNWENILSWKSPVGLAIFFIGAGVLFYLTGWARTTNDDEKEE